KGRAVITEVTGEVVSIEEKPAEHAKVVTVKGATDSREYQVSSNARMKVEEGSMVRRGDALIEGSIDQKQLLSVSVVLTIENYLLKEVQKAYRSQGVEIGDKHVEVMVRQMLRKVRILDPGDTDELPGTLV